MHTLITVLHVVVSIFLCLVILLQSGRGGGMGTAFGGASSQIFGGRGAGNFLSRLTSIAAVVFFLTSLTLSMMSSQQHSVVKPTAKTSIPSSTTPDNSVEPTQKQAADNAASDTQAAPAPAATPAPAPEAAAPAAPADKAPAAPAPADKPATP